MYTWIIYDIVRDSIREKVARRCKQYGLRRVQKSVFLGRLKKARVRPLRRELTGLVNLRTDVVFILRIDRKQYRRLIRIGKKDPGAWLRPESGVFHF